MKSFIKRYKESDDEVLQDNESELIKCEQGQLEDTIDNLESQGKKVSRVETAEDGSKLLYLQNESRNAKHSRLKEGYTSDYTLVLKGLEVSNVKVSDIKFDDYAPENKDRDEEDIYGELVCNFSADIRPSNDIEWEMSGYHFEVDSDYDDEWYIAESLNIKSGTIKGSAIFNNFALTDYNDKKHLETGLIDSITNAYLDCIIHSWGDIDNHYECTVYDNAVEYYNANYYGHDKYGDVNVLFNITFSQNGDAPNELILDIENPYTLTDALYYGLEGESYFTNGEEEYEEKRLPKFNHKSFRENRRRMFRESEMKFDTNYNCGAYRPEQLVSVKNEKGMEFLIFDFDRDDFNNYWYSNSTLPSKMMYILKSDRGYIPFYSGKMISHNELDEDNAKLMLCYFANAIDY